MPAQNIQTHILLQKNYNYVKYFSKKVGIFYIYYTVFVGRSFTLILLLEYLY